MEWKDGLAKDITFIVTKDCQLACSYCYLVGKNSNERMSWETAKECVDFILGSRDDELMDYPSVVFNFIGGEPFLEIDLIDRICDYLKLKMYLTGHRWFDSYRFSITTNGINYDSPKVQDFIRKNKRHLSITITIDGTRAKHDVNRIWRGSGKGSYDDVAANIPLWLEQFPDAATKVTVSSPDIPYVRESVLHLFSMGIHTVFMNCVHENVWKEGDDVVFEEQMRLLADDIIERGLYPDFECTLFDPTIGHPLDDANDSNWCGSGLMLAMDAGGNFYPCTRFAKYSLRNKGSRMIGNCRDGIDRDKVRPFLNLSRRIQSDPKCLACEVASGCAWCQGENYDSADTSTIYQRATAVCLMHKARVRANDYFWSQYEASRKYDCDVTRRPSAAGHHAVAIGHDEAGLPDKSSHKPETYMVLLSSDHVRYCIAGNQADGNEEILMRPDVLEKTVNKAEREGVSVCFVYPPHPVPSEIESLVDESLRNHSGKGWRKIVSSGYGMDADAFVIDGISQVGNARTRQGVYIVNTAIDDFVRNVDSLEPLLNVASKVEIVFSDEARFSSDVSEAYGKSLQVLSDMVLSRWSKGNCVDVNLLTDRLYLKSLDECGAGWSNVTVGPDGSFHICPAFYHHAGKHGHSSDFAIGNIDDGLNIRNQHLFNIDHAPVCGDCGAWQCRRCVYLNHLHTLEVNVPGYGQCLKSKLELEATKDFFQRYVELWGRCDHANQHPALKRSFNLATLYSKQS